MRTHLAPRLLACFRLLADWLVRSIQHFGGDGVSRGRAGRRPLPGLLPVGREFLAEEKRERRLFHTADIAWFTAVVRL